MNEDRLKKAFQKIKKDMDKLSQEVTSLKIEIARSVMGNSNLASEVEDSVLNKKVDNFVGNVEEEFKKINFSIREIEDRTLHNAKKQEQIEFQYNKLKKNDEKNHAEIEKNYLSVSSIEGRFLEFTELITEKINLEMNSLRLEFTDEVAKIYDIIYSSDVDLRKGSGSLRKSEVGRKVNVKKDGDIALKPVEVDKKNKVEKKKTVKKPLIRKTESSSSILKNKKSEIEEVIYDEEEGRARKPNRVKKVLKWLFVDEEDEEHDFDEVKREVGKGNSGEKK